MQNEVLREEGSWVSVSNYCKEKCRASLHEQTLSNIDIRERVNISLVHSWRTGIESQLAIFRIQSDKSIRI